MYFFLQFLHVCVCVCACVHRSIDVSMIIYVSAGVYTYASVVDFVSKLDL